MLFKECFISFYVIKGSHSCGSTTATVTGDKAPLDLDVTNPCTTQALASNEYFFAYSKDRTKFIHCDVWLNAWVTSCPPSLVWNQQSHACIADQHHEASNPCTQEQLDNGITMFPHPDPHMYIHCDSGLNQWVQSCVGGTVFDFASQTCVWENALSGWRELWLFFYVFINVLRITLIIFPSFFPITFIDSACNLLLCEIITCALNSYYLIK